MVHILEGIPYMLGGMMISSAMSLNSRSTKESAETSTTGGSLYNFFNIDIGTKWKSSFLSGMIFAASLVASVYGFDEIENTHVKPFEAEKLFFKGTGLIQFMISGFLTGLGLKLASGGLGSFSFYGIPRFNSPSMTATGIAFIFTAITATLRSSFHILQGINITKKFNEHLDFRLSLFVPLIMMAFTFLKNYKDMNSVKEIAKSFGIGNLLSAGLMMAGLGRRHQLLDFFSLNDRWNPFLLFVFAGGFLGHLLMTNFLGYSAPISGDVSAKSVGPKTFLGCALFGTGLGISGLIPGAGLLVSAVYLPQIILFFLPFIAIGQFAGGFVNNLTSKTEKLIKSA